MDGVGHDLVLRSRGLMRAVGGRGGVDGDGVVVEGTEVEVHPVAADRYRGRDEVMAGARRGRKFLYRVASAVFDAVIRQCAERVVRLGRGTRGRLAEPDTRLGVELCLIHGIAVIGLDQGRVVGICAIGVGVPAGGGVEHAVVVGDHHVRLAGGLARHEEGDAGHGGAGPVVVVLGELDVAADDLLGVLRRDIGIDERARALRRDLHHVDRGRAEQIAARGFGFLDGYGAERADGLARIVQVAGVARDCGDVGDTVGSGHDGPGARGLAGEVVGGVIAVKVADGVLGARKGGRTERVFGT